MAITKISSALIGANTIATSNIADNAVDGTKIAQNSILTKHIDDNQIVTSHIADDAVTLAKMDGLARGKIIYGDASGNPAALALGSNGTVLKSDGTDIAWGTDATVAALTSEEVQDIAGAMFSSNTETGITATYQDADGTIDLVVGTLNQNTTGTAATVTTAAQPNITSLGTLTTLTVDDITINGSTISDGADLTLDVEGNIVLDANGGGVYFKDDGTTIGFFQNDGGDFRMISSVNDKDMKFIGTDGGSLVTALTLDMSSGGRANFNNDIGLNDDRGLRLGSGDDSVIYNDGSNLYIKNSTSNHDIIFQGNDDGSAITAMTIDMSIGGSVGIGETSPSAKLDVVTDSVVYTAEFTNSKTSNGDGVKIQIGSAAASEYAFDVRSDAGSTQIISAKGDGTVAIGTGTPTTQFTVTKSANIAQVAITSSSNAVAWDSTAAANAYHVTTENTTFSAPSNAVEGAIISVELAQGGTARTIGWNTVFEFAESTAPTVTATASKTDIFSFRYNGSVWQEIGRVQNMAQT